MALPDNPYPELKWVVYYEKEGFGNPSIAELEGDLGYIKSNYATSPSYLKIDGKPVVFVYNAVHSGYSPTEDLSRWKTARAQSGFYVNMKKDPLNSGANPADMDSWHEYGPASRSGQVNSYSYFISPGFWKDQNAVRLVRNFGSLTNPTQDASSFTAALSKMVQTNATWKLTETWNEWGEGSGVEPAMQVNQTTGGAATINSGAPAFRHIYIDALN